MSDKDLKRWLALMIVRGHDLDEAYEQAAVRMGGGTLDFAVDPRPLSPADERAPEMEDIPYADPIDATDRPEGTPDTLYVNAYAVTRHLGGVVDDEEWFYHVADALGSIPIPATWRMTEMAGPELLPDGPITWAVDHLHAALGHLNVGDICHGGVRVDVEVERHLATSYPGGAPDCEESDPTAGSGPVL